MEACEAAVTRNDRRSTSSPWNTPRVEDDVVERKEKARKREEKEAKARKRKEARKAKILSSTARGVLTQAHYKLKVARIGGQVVKCEEEYASKICPSCGEIKENLGGSIMYKGLSCHVVLDRYVNAVKNIFHTNMALLC
ncbi:hypothetical protein BBJ28_00016303 [Nothophytophthora sp. Chile5]|nr:hypothetical protein BBJ28_00016303 [Nothophytophthora sp. Chile5]